MRWVYIKSEPGLWTVGFYGPDGGWHPNSDHDSPKEAADQVRFLNIRSKSKYTAAQIIEKMAEYPIYEQGLDTPGFAFWANELCKKALNISERRWLNMAEFRRAAREASDVGLVDSLKEAVFNVKKHGTTNLNDPVREWLNTAEFHLAAHEKEKTTKPIPDVMGIDLNELLKLLRGISEICLMFKPLAVHGPKAE